MVLAQKPGRWIPVWHEINQKVEKYQQLLFSFSFLSGQHMRLKKGKFELIGLPNAPCTNILAGYK